MVMSADAPLTPNPWGDDKTPGERPTHEHETIRGQVKLPDGSWISRGSWSAAYRLLACLAWGRAVSRARLRLAGASAKAWARRGIARAAAIVDDGKRQDPRDVAVDIAGPIRDADWFHPTGSPPKLGAYLSTRTSIGPVQDEKPTVPQRQNIDAFTAKFKDVQSAFDDATTVYGVFDASRKCSSRKCIH